MNLFIRELVSYRKATIVWGVVMLVFMYTSMVKYGALASDAAASQKMLAALPSTLQAVFGMTGLDITTIVGYYGVCFIFIAVMLAIHAGMLGAGIIAKEETNKTAEFLYTKPISRTRAFVTKFFAGLLIIAVIATVTYAATVASIAAANHGDVPYQQLAVFTLALGIIQLTFYCVGIGTAAAFAIPKKASTLVAALVFVAYFAYVLQGLSSTFSWFTYLSPFAYFNAKDIIATGALTGGYVLLCGALCLAVLAVGYRQYVRRDFDT